MCHDKRRMLIVALMVAAALQLAACGQTSTVSASKVQPVTIEKNAETGLNRLVLTEKAAQRINVQTVPVREEQVNGSQRMVIPYAAVIYGLKGETWAYTNPAPLTFVRQKITIDFIDGDKVILKERPAAGTAIVTVGVPELYGADTGIGK